MKGIYCDVKNCRWCKKVDKVENYYGVCRLDSIDINKNGVCQDISIG